MTTKKIHCILLNGVQNKKNPKAKENAVIQIMDDCLNYLERRQLIEVQTFINYMVEKVTTMSSNHRDWQDYISIIKKVFNYKKYNKIFIYCSKENYINSPDFKNISTLMRDIEEVKKAPSLTNGF